MTCSRPMILKHWLVSESPRQLDENAKAWALFYSAYLEFCGLVSSSGDSDTHPVSYFAWATIQNTTDWEGGRVRQLKVSHSLDTGKSKIKVHQGVVSGAVPDMQRATFSLYPYMALPWCLCKEKLREHFSLSLHL